MTSVAYGLAMPASRGVLTQAAPWWLPAGKALYADVPNGRYWAGGQVCATFASWLAAAGGSFSGAAGRYYTTSGGTLAAAALNVARSAHYIGGTPYLLYEPAATNYLHYSNDFTQAAWSKIAAGTGSTAVVTAIAGTAPDGTSTAQRIQFSKGTGTTASDYSLISQSPSGTGTNTFLKGLWAKSNTGATQNLLIYDANAATGTVVTVTAAWQRLSPAAGSSTSGPVLTFGTRGGSGQYFTGGDASLDILAWNATIEARLAFSSDVVATATSATRAAESISGLSAAGSLTVTFDDASTQAISSASFATAANLNRSTIAKIAG